MKETSKGYVKYKKENRVSYIKSIFSFSSTAILKFGIAIALLIMLSYVVMALTVTSDGNVGIGTTSPGAKLHVQASTANDGYGLRTSASDFARWRIVNPDVDNTVEFGTTGGNTLRFITDGTARMTITETTGRVGIGTTSPGALLHVMSSDAAGVSPNANARFALERSGTGNYIEFIGATTADEHGLLWSDSGGNPAQLYYNFNLDRMTIATSGTIAMTGGNVGIGTTNPTAKLDVQSGDIHTSGIYRAGNNAGVTAVLNFAPPPCDKTVVTQMVVTGGIITSYTETSGGTCGE